MIDENDVFGQGSVAGRSVDLASRVEALEKENGELMERLAKIEKRLSGLDRRTFGLQRIGGRKPRY